MTISSAAVLKLYRLQPAAGGPSFDVALCNPSLDYAEPFYTLYTLDGTNSDMGPVLPHPEPYFAPLREQDDTLFRTWEQCEVSWFQALDKAGIRVLEDGETYRG